MISSLGQKNEVDHNLWNIYEGSDGVNSGRVSHATRYIYVKDGEYYSPVELIIWLACVSPLALAIARSHQRSVPSCHN